MTERHGTCSESCHGHGRVVRWWHHAASSRSPGQSRPEPARGAARAAARAERDARRRTAGRDPARGQRRAVQAAPPLRRRAAGQGPGRVHADGARRPAGRTGRRGLHRGAAALRGQRGFRPGHLRTRVHPGHGRLHDRGHGGGPVPGHRARRAAGPAAHPAGQGDAVGRVRRGHPVHRRDGRPAHARLRPAGHPLGRAVQGPLGVPGGRAQPGARRRPAAPGGPGPAALGGAVLPQPAQPVGGAHHAPARAARHPPADRGAGGELPGRAALRGRHRPDRAHAGAAGRAARRPDGPARARMPRPARAHRRGAVVAPPVRGRHRARLAAPPHRGDRPPPVEAPRPRHAGYKSRLCRADNLFVCHPGPGEFNVLGKKPCPGSVNAARPDRAQPGRGHQAGVRTRARDPRRRVRGRRRDRGPVGGHRVGPAAPRRGAGRLAAAHRRADGAFADRAVLRRFRQRPGIPPAHARDFRRHFPRPGTSRATCISSPATPRPSTTTRWPSAAGSSGRSGASASGRSSAPCCNEPTSATGGSPRSSSRPATATSRSRRTASSTPAATPP